MGEPSDRTVECITSTKKFERYEKSPAGIGPSESREDATKKEKEGGVHPGGEGTVLGLPMGFSLVVL